MVQWDQGINVYSLCRTVPLPGQVQTEGKQLYRGLANGEWNKQQVYKEDKNEVLWYYDMFLFLLGYLRDEFNLNFNLS